MAAMICCFCLEPIFWFSAAKLCEIAEELTVLAGFVEFVLVTSLVENWL
jgi:hypothetical protein